MIKETVFESEIKRGRERDKESQREGERGEGERENKKRIRKRYNISHIPDAHSLRTEGRLVRQMHWYSY